jgi:hypothetical protein
MGGRGTREDRGKRTVSVVDSLEDPLSREINRMRAWTPLLAALALVPTPASAQQAQLLTLASGFTPDPRSVSLKAGGDVEVDEGSCTYGYISESGAMGLDYEAGALDLYVYVQSDIDTMLLISTPSNEFLCDDDSHGSLNPRIHIEDPESGRYIVFVGGYTQNEYRDATVYFTELDPDIFGEGSPSFVLDPVFGSVELGRDFSPDPHTVSLRAGGEIDVNVGGCSVGHVSDAPSFNLRYAGGAELHVSARSDDDTTILINTPAGEWLCDDDSLGDSNPLVSIPGAAEGLYNIWVGTYDGAEAQATLSISRKAPK